MSSLPLPPDVQLWVKESASVSQADGRNTQTRREWEGGGNKSKKKNISSARVQKAAQLWIPSTRVALKRIKQIAARHNFRPPLFFLFFYFKRTAAAAAAAATPPTAHWRISFIYLFIFFLKPNSNAESYLAILSHFGSSYIYWLLRSEPCIHPLEGWLYSNENEPSRRRE